MGDHRTKVRAQREARDKAEARAKTNAERRRMHGHQPWMDVDSPVGYGRVFELLAPRGQDVTPDAWEVGKAPGKKPFGVD